MLDILTFQTELESIVNIDSGTYVRDGVNKMADIFAEKFTSLGWQINWFETDASMYGRSFVCAPNLEQDFDLLVLCHHDTVFPEGEVAARPFSIEGTKFKGPGVADMKTGLLFTWHALRQLHEEGKIVKNIAVFFNAEHEISCPNTRVIIEALSKRSKVAVTSESARANGANVYKKKGIARYTIKFTGKAAHSGVNPLDGVDAIEELAHWILYFKSLINPDKGIYFNPGMVSGGKAINVVPETAELKLDVRFTDYADGKEIDALIRSRINQPFNPAIEIELEGGIRRPPMTPVARTKTLQEIVEGIGRKKGHDVTWGFSGGGSDASFAAALGVPSLCGMAGVGGALHSKDEYLETSDLITRFEIYKETLDAFSKVEW